MTRKRIRALMLLALAACGNAAGGDDPPAKQSPPPAFDRPGMVQFHMRQHFGDLRQVERLLLAGKLDDARSLAFLLTKSASDPGMKRWEHEVDQVTHAAQALVEAPGVDEAVRREARVAAACAHCHVRTQKLPVFSAASRVPADTGTAAVRMARHQWAADRLWEGIVGGANKPWRAGLEILAATPLPYSALTDAPVLATRLQDLARSGLESTGAGAAQIDERARLYGEMLVTCAACHSSLDTKQRAR